MIKLHYILHGWRLVHYEFYVDRELNRTLMETIALKLDITTKSHCWDTNNKMWSSRFSHRRVLVIGPVDSYFVENPNRLRSHRLHLYSHVIINISVVRIIFKSSRRLVSITRLMSRTIALNNIHGGIEWNWTELNVCSFHTKKE